jgi:ferredoxin-thioredoxin reductase catalytic subunit
MANPWDHVVGTEEYNTTLERSLKTAERGGYILNPDSKRVEKVVGLMTMNFTATGRYFCPCKQSHPLNTETDELCPCEGMQEEIKTNGKCFCRLFYKKI